MCRRIVCVAVLLVIGSASLKAQSGYGLVTDEDSFPYSYYLTNSTLLVKSYEDFHEASQADWLIEDQKEADSIFNGFFPSEGISLPVIQTILPGDHYVLVFERVYEDTEIIPNDTFLVVYRLALELDTLKDTLYCPEDFRGCVIIDEGHEWPPEFLALDSGVVVIESHVRPCGTMCGSLSVRAARKYSYSGQEHVWQERIKGDFVLRDRQRALFLNMPAR